MGESSSRSDGVTPDQLVKAAECFKALAHPGRLAMLMMMTSGRHTVGDLAEGIGIPPAQASSHLRLMQRCGLLEREPDGRQIYYTLSESHLVQIMRCVERHLVTSP